MASFGEALVSSFTATYGTMARAGLQAEQAAYLRNQREGVERFQQEDATLRQQFGVEGAPQAPAAPPATGNVQQATQPQPAPQAAPAAQPQVPAQAPAQSAVGNAQAAQPAREPPLTQEQLNQISQSGDAVTQAAAARIISPQPQGAPGEMGDTRGPAALANEVATSSGARGRPLTRADWNGYYEARIQSAQANLPPDQAIRMVSMLDGLRQRGFSQSVSLATAAAAAGDAQGATRALTAASNFLPDGFRDDFRVAANGQAIELIRTPEEGGGTPSRTVIPLNQVERYATTLLDPKWALTHYLNVRTQAERERSNRVGERQRAEELKLRRDDREERRELELNSGAAIESARTVANAEVAYSRALQSGDQEAITKASEALTTAEQKDAELVGRGLNTRGATGRNAAVTAVRSAAQRQESIQLRAERDKALTEIARESLAATVTNREEVNARGRDRLAQFDRRLDQHAAALEFRLDVETAKRERDSARDDESKRIANEKLRIAEERLNLYSREVNRRAQPRAELPAATRTELNRYEENRSADGKEAPANPRLGGSASEFYVSMAQANPRLRGSDVGRLTDEFFRDPTKFEINRDFSVARHKATGSQINLPENLQETLRGYASATRSGGTPGETPAPRDNGSMQRPATTQAPAQSALERARGRATPAPTQPTAARPRTVDAWVAQNAPAEGRGGLSDRELQQAAGWYNVPVVELRQRMKAWRQVEVPGGL
jgi:hypothetical protein